MNQLPPQLNNNRHNVLVDFGFSPDFFTQIEKKVYIIERNPMRKISSANAVLALPIEDQISKKKIWEAEDKELYQEEETWSVSRQENSISENSLNNGNGQKFMSQCSNDQMIHLANIISELNANKQSRQVIKAYKSKLKSKFQRIYETNSQNYLENVKYKLFHKCCYPNCGRTFSSSGWLKAHFEEHLKDLENNTFNVLFDKFINNSKFVLNNSSINNIYNANYIHYNCNVRNGM